jgi:hypothetical protein
LKVVLRRNKGRRKALVHRWRYYVLIKMGSAMAPTISATPSEPECGNVWQTARRLGLYGRDDVELEALIALYRTAPLPADRWTIEAAHFVRDLRREGAAGTFV